MARLKPASGDAVEYAINSLRKGEAVIFPTDTVYGIGVSVDRAESPQLLFDLKERDAGKAIPLLVGSRSELDRLGADVPDYARAFAKRYWPGALTIIVRASADVPAAFQASNGTVALRMPAHPLALTLLQKLDGPIATSSANFQGQLPPCTLDEVSNVLAQCTGAVLSDGNPVSGVSSTIVDCTGKTPHVLRQGTVRSEWLTTLFEHTYKSYKGGLHAR